MDGANQKTMKDNRGEMFADSYHRRVWLEINRGREAGGEKKKNLILARGRNAAPQFGLPSYSSPRLNWAGSCAGTSGKLIAIHKVSAARRLVGALCFHEGKGTGGH